MWTPSIIPRTTESLTCWTSATWRAGEGQRAKPHCYLQKFVTSLTPSLPFPRDLAVIVASMAYNTWFTKLYCKDLRIVCVKFSCFTVPECVEDNWWNFNDSCFFPSGIRGHRAGLAHSQQILQPGGDHTGKRWAKIVSSYILFKGQFLYMQISLFAKGRMSA